MRLLHHSPIPLIKRFLKQLETDHIKPHQLLAFRTQFPRLMRQGRMEIDQSRLRPVSHFAHQFIHSFRAPGRGPDIEL